MGKQQVRRLTFPSLSSPPKTQLTYGSPFQDVCAKYIDNELQAKRVMIIASHTLSQKTDNLQKLQTVLGSKVASVSSAIRMHTSLDAIFPLVNEVIEKGIDCIVTLGGGSIGDGAQVVAFAAANNATDADALIPYHLQNKSMGPSVIKAPTIPIIFIPTTLSAAEYSKVGAATDPRTHEKFMFGHDDLYANLVILDPTVTLSMSLDSWIASGVRAIDHCIEGICSSSAREESDAALTEALTMLVPGLLQTKADPSDEMARLNCMLGCNLSMTALLQGVPKGASHGIGHQLGPFGVEHGVTSCILNPAVMKYNKSANEKQQSFVKEILWREDVAAGTLTKAGLTKETSDLGDADRAIFNALGMPKTLKDVGVERKHWPTIASNSLRDWFCTMNFIPLTKEEQVIEILEMVSGD